MAWEVVLKLVHPHQFVEGRLQEIHGNIELDEERGKDGVGIVELDYQKHTAVRKIGVYVCVHVCVYV